MWLLQIEQIHPLFLQSGSLSGLRSLSLMLYCLHLGLLPASPSPSLMPRAFTPAAPFAWVWLSSLFHGDSSSCHLQCAFQRGLKQSHAPSSPATYFSPPPLSDLFCFWDCGHSAPPLSLHSSLRARPFSPFTDIPTRQLDTWLEPSYYLVGNRGQA